MTKKRDTLLHRCLFVSFLVTVMVPLTGVHIHKLASVVFLLLCGVHTVKYRGRLNGKRLLLWGLIALSFLSGIFGMIFDHIPMVLQIHKAVSIGITGFLAIHIFVFHKKL